MQSMKRIMARCLFFNIKMCEYCANKDRKIVTHFLKCLVMIFFNYFQFSL